jgi:dipeptidyl aminopeptidase/acylaminoacyl peptidase
MSLRPITAEDLWAFPRVGTPVPLPDGSAAIVPVTTYDLETNEGTTRLWNIAASASGGPESAAAPRPLTSSESSASAPAISPDGSQIVFVRKPGSADDTKAAAKGRKHGDQAQLYRLPLDGGEAECLTDLPLGVAAPCFLPDGRRVAFLATVLSEAPTAEASAELAAKRKDDPVKAHVTEDRVYRYWDRWLTDGQIHHIMVLDLETREIVDLMPDSTRWLGLFSVEGAFDISPDGREIAFSACRTEPPHQQLVFGIYRVPVPDLASKADPTEPTLLHPDHEGPAMRARYSPDGRFLVYGVQHELGFYADRVRLVAYDRSAGTHTTLTEDWDSSAQGWTFGADAGTLFLTAEVGARNAIFSLDLEAAIKDPAANPPRQLVLGGSFAAPQPAGGRLFTTLQDLSHPPEVHVCDLDGGNLTKLSDFTDALLSELELGEVEEAFFEGAEGHQVQMFLVYPPESRRTAGKPLPLVHLVHGGPHGTFGDFWHFRWNAHAFASPGYLAAHVNFHGFGDAFTRSILGRWGDQPSKDVMKATDLLIEQGLVDPERMAITGGSYGGYLVSYLAGITDRFACIINHAGVCDFQTQFASDITQGRRKSMGGELWENLEGLDRYNPIRQAANFKTPMLVIHGMRDFRVPYNQGLVIYNVYKARELPARLVVYPDENHWILKPRNSLHWYGEVHDWLARWLA